MRCHKCGASSRVLYTSDLGDQFLVKRRRECDNLHRFVTHEVHVQVVAQLSAKKVKLVTDRFRSWVARYKEDLHVWVSRKSGESFHALASRLSKPNSSIRSMYLRIDRRRKKSEP